MLQYYVKFSCTLLGCLLIQFQINAQSLPEGLYINEFSNGPSGSLEYVELLVGGDPCAFVDIRNWILDDNNGDFSMGGSGASGIASGYIKFKNIPQWSAVPVGSLIVIYNNNERNSGLPTDDETDSNKDNIYVLSGASIALEGCGSTPNTSTSVYGCTTFGTSTWQYVGVRNQGDAIQIRRPNSDFFHGIAYGSGITTPPIGGIVFNASNAGNISFRFVGTDIRNINDWEITPANTNETPAAANSTSNSDFLKGFQIIDIDLGNDTIVCNSSQILLKSQYPNTQWNTGEIAESIFVNKSGTYIAQFSIGACSNSDTIEVLFQDPPQINLGKDTTICQGDSVEFSSGFVNSEWSTGDTTTTIIASIAGFYCVEVRDNSCVGRDTIQLIIQNQFKIDLGRDTLFCEGGSLKLESKLQNTVWSTGEIGGSIFITKSGQYIASGISTACVEADTIQIQVLANRQFSIGKDTSVCIGTIFQYSNPYDLRFLKWESGANLSCFECREGSVEIVDSLTEIRVIDPDFSNELCNINSDTLRIIGVNPQRYLNLDTVLAPGGKVHIQSISNGMHQIQVKPEIFSSCQNCDNPIITVYGKHTIQIIGKDFNNCPVSFVLNVDILENCGVFLPNAFSPNGDGTNDIFEPLLKFPNIIDAIQMQIWNRWGQLLYNQSGLDVNWDGISNSEEQDIEVYIVQIQVECNNAIHTISRNLTLIR